MLMLMQSTVVFIYQIIVLLIFIFGFNGLMILDKSCIPSKLFTANLSTIKSFFVLRKTFVYTENNAIINQPKWP